LSEHFENFKTRRGYTLFDYTIPVNEPEAVPLVAVREPEKMLAPFNLEKHLFGDEIET
jgi:hypothetical protein